MMAEPGDKAFADALIAEVGGALATSWLVPQAGRGWVMLFDVETPAGKRLVAGKCMGRAADDGQGMVVSEVGQVVVERMSRLRGDRFGQLVVVELKVRDIARVRERVRWSLESCRAGEQALLFVSPDERIIAWLTVLLGLRFGETAPTVPAGRA